MRRRSVCLIVELALTASTASNLVACGRSDSELDPPSACLDAGVDTSCTPAYGPTYDALYANTFQRACAASGVSCHASTGRQADLDFGDPDRGYEGLTRGMVQPGNPECSVLVQVVLSTDGKTRMPPGRSLSESETCAIIQWIARGAPR